MGLFDIFTGAPAKKAAEQAKQAAGQQRSYFDQVGGANTAAIEGGLDLSLGALTQGYNTGAGAVGQGYSDASGYLNSGAGAARAAYDPLKALSSKYGGATTMALNSLGVNGAQGQADARGAFQAGPAYNFNMEQGLEAINRRRAAGGMLDGGNADRDAQTFGAGLASNEYDKWMNQLLGFTSPELAATSGTATGLAGIETGLGQGQAGLATQRGSMMADLAQRYGTGQAGLQTGAANAKVGSALALAQPYANTYKQEADASKYAADAQMAGSKNMWGLGMNLASLGTGLIPGGGIGAMFGGGGNPSMGGNSNPFMSSGNVNPAYMQYG